MGLRLRSQRFAYRRLPAVAPILLTAVALLVMVIREGRRLWSYRDQHQLTELLGAADAVVVVSLMGRSARTPGYGLSGSGSWFRSLPLP